MPDQYDDKFDAIIRFIQDARRIAEHHIPAVRVDIETIVRTGITSENHIERVLDTVLNLMLCGYGEAEFEQLCTYYGTLNAEHAAAYRRIRADLLDE